MRCVVLLAISLLLAAQEPRKADDDHIFSCHTDWLHFYRIQLTERDAAGRDFQSWTKWTLIDDRKPSDKQEINEQLAFYRSNHIKIEYWAMEGKLPK